MKNPRTKKQLCITGVATLAGVGYAPLCPGTFASLVGLLVFLTVPDSTFFLIITVISLVAAFLSSGPAERIFAKKDAREIVIDDFCGMLIAYLFIPHDIRFIIAGFFLFRMFDMLKIPPADCIEKRKGAVGVVGDDVIAGIYANLILQIVRVLTGS